jgi:hypothetical protein
MKALKKAYLEASRLKTGYANRYRILTGNNVDLGRSNLSFLADPESTSAASGTVGFINSVLFPDEEISASPWSDRYSQVLYQPITCLGEIEGLLVRNLTNTVDLCELPESTTVEFIDLSEHELGWSKYLQDLKADQQSHPFLADDIISVRNQLHNYFGVRIEPPQASPGDEDGIRLLWETPRHQLAVDVLPNRCIHWFYRNRETEIYDGGENVPTDKFPPETLQSFLDEWRKDLHLDPHAGSTDCPIAAMASRDARFG